MSEFEELEEISIGPSGPRSHQGQAVSLAQRRKAAVDRTPFHRSRQGKAAANLRNKPVTLPPVQFTRRHDGQSQA